MLIFEVENIEPFIDAMSIVHRYDYMGVFKCSPTMFTVIVPQSYSPHCVVALNLWAQFFTRFACDQESYVRISLNDFFMIMIDMQLKGNTSLILSIAEHQPFIVLEFRTTPGQEIPFTTLQPIAPPSRDENVGEIDYGSFASLDLEVFRRVVLGLDNAPRASVTITDSQIKFLVENMEIILTTERRECIIGGISAGEEIQSTMNLYPMEFYYNFMSRRVWLFKAIDSNCVILVAPMRFNAQILSYFPEGL